MLEGYKLMMVEAPASKMREDERGNEVPVLDRDGVRQFVVSLLVRQRAVAGQRAAKGEEIRVTLETDPGPGFGEDTVVSLVDPRVTPSSRPPSTDRRRLHGRTVVDHVDKFQDAKCRTTAEHYSIIPIGNLAVNEEIRLGDVTLLPPEDERVPGEPWLSRD